MISKNTAVFFGGWNAKLHQLTNDVYTLDLENMVRPNTTSTIQITFPIVAIILKFVVPVYMYICNIHSQILVEVVQSQVVELVLLL